MKIQYCSDLHLEFGDNADFLRAHPIVPAGDILVLAGDVMLFSDMQVHNAFLDMVSEQFDAVYWLPGNHEYYHSDINRRSGSFTENIRENVFLLNNSVVEHDGVRLVFSTMWSHVSPFRAWLVQQGMADFQVIKDGGHPFTVNRFNEFHANSLRFLKETLSQGSNAGTIVVTHHVPTLEQYPSKYKQSPLNEAFVSNQDRLIAESGADYWIYGHHHQYVPAFEVGRTRLVTNQLGYVKRQEHGDFDHQACIEVGIDYQDNKVKFV